MGVIFNDWCNANELRSYPVVELTDRRADNGKQLPNDLLVDVNIRMPESAGTRVAVSSASVTAGIVSMTFVADGGGTPVPLCAVSIARPIAKFHKYPLEAFYPGAGGWVVFGSAAEQADQFNLLFSTFAECELIPKVVRNYHTLPVSSFGKQFRTKALTGLVELLAGNDIEILACTVDWPVGPPPSFIDNPRYKRLLDGAPRDCIAIRLSATPGNLDTLYRYVGPCDGSPEDDKCGRRLLRRISGVSAGCDGNLEIEFIGIPSAPVLNQLGVPVGIQLEYPLGLIDVCDQNKGLVIPEPGDLCASSSQSTHSGSSMSMSSQFLSSTSSLAPVCPNITEPYSDPFTSLGCWSYLVPEWSLVGGEMNGINLSSWTAIYKEGSHTLGHLLKGRIKTVPGDNERAAFIFGVESYSKYWFVEYNVALQRVQILRRNGPVISQESLPMTMVLPSLAYFDVTVDVSVGGLISTWVDAVAGPTVTAVPGLLVDGPAGFAVRASEAYFNLFSIDM